MAEESKETSSVSDPMSYMVSVAIELHEMKKALIEAGFTSKEAVFIVGQAVAAGAMLPISEFGPDDVMDMQARGEFDDDEGFDDENDTLL